MLFINIIPVAFISGISFYIPAKEPLFDGYVIVPRQYMKFFVFKIDMINVKLGNRR